MNEARRKRRRDALRHIPVIGTGASREYWEDVLKEPPPQSPSAPWTSEVPPEWMLEPVPVLDPSTQEPLHWVDDAPYRLWAERAGRARYKLMLLDGLKPEEEDDKNDGSPPAWLPPRHSWRTPLSVINHPAELLTVKERQESGATAPWTSRSWINANPRKGRPVVAAPQDGDDLPQAECSIAPWWLEK
ncbi:hypothetical protein ABZY81_18130 [Streptomyces sp. NPDC006514]|uniref:hypothetical protein n=1 Tax=Streptomyces sp. NPDC006514 TaxID=3154308 RepID=UPI00339FA061